MNYSVVIVAAGKGSRTNLEYNKVFYKINGESVIHKTLSVFMQDEECVEIIVVISKVEQAMFEHLLDSDKIVYVEGGSTRQESVYNGLEAVSSAYVMIHDGARPYLTNKEVGSLKQILKKEDACLLMVPVIDTIKIVEDGYVVSTPQRSTCFAAQTPQCFKTSMIIDCHRKAIKDGFIASDDAQLVEKYGGKVKVVMGDYANKKITTKEDLD